MLSYRKKAIIAAFFGLSTATAAIAAIPRFPNVLVLQNGGPAEIFVAQMFAAVGAQGAARIALFGSTFAAQQQAKFELLMSALSVSTKQEAVSGNMQAEAIQNSGSALVSSIRAVNQSENIVNATLDFNPALGQGYDACGTMVRNKTLDRAFTQMPHAAQQKMAKTDVAPGRMVGSRQEAMKERLKRHHLLFCNESEAARGVCKLSDLPGGDTNASLLFEPAPAGSLQATARQAWRENVLGAPDATIPASSAKTAEGQQYAFLKQRKDALLSVPAYSLAMIETANTQVPEFGNKSPNEILKARVNAYFGGEEAKKWSANMASQRARGLLVEQAKMGGVETWLRWQEYEQTGRLEANLATLVLLSAEKYQPVLSDQHRRLLADAVAREIK